MGVLSDIAKKSAAASDKAVTTLDRIVPQAGKAASEAGFAKRIFGDVAKKAKKNITRWGGEANRAGENYQAALNKARDFSARAKEAFSDAQAKTVTGEITAADAAKAEAEVSRAENAMHVACGMPRF